MTTANDIPIHEQISGALIDRIRSGDWVVGTKLPSEATLMAKFSASRGTVRRALRTLNEQGYVSTVHGKGTFVTAGKAQPSIAQHLVGLSEVLSYSSNDLTTTVLEKKLLEGKDIGGFVPEDAHLDGPVLFLDRIRFLGGIPVARLKNWILVDKAPTIVDFDFEKASLLQALDECAITPVSNGTREFRAVNAPEDICESLSVATSYPLQFLQQVTFLADGEVVEWSDVWMDSAQIGIKVNLFRTH